MLVRNNTECTSCGERSTMDLSKALGHIKRRFKPNCVSLALTCRFCGHAIFINIEQDDFLELVRRVNQHTGSHLSWCHFVHLNPHWIENADETEKIQVCVWAANAGFIRDVHNPHLFQNSILTDFVSVCLHRFRLMGGTGVDVSLRDFPAGQPLAS
jgi:hypothetical protein